ncbi:MAG: rod shape-determining protein MreD [Clostridia bacterium]|nr:rod shape-determining protein MreD [Clostridia bacterium]
MKILWYGLWLVLLTLLQPTLICELTLFGIHPNLFLCFVVIAGYYRGPLEGGIAGALFGLVYDLLIGRLMGVDALLYLYLGVMAGILGTRFFSGGKRLAICATAGAGTLLCAVVYYLVRMTVWGDISFVTAVFRIGLIEALYQLPVAFLLSFVIAKTMKWMRLRQIS